MESARLSERVPVGSFYKTNIEAVDDVRSKYFIALWIPAFLLIIVSVGIWQTFTNHAQSSAALHQYRAYLAEVEHLENNTIEPSSAIQPLRRFASRLQSIRSDTNGDYVTNFEKSLAYNQAFNTGLSQLLQGNHSHRSVVRGVLEKAFSYTVGAFSLWGGGFLSSLGVIDYSGGYVIHLSAGIAGFVGAAVIGPRLARDRENFQPNNVLLMLVGAGILWLGWNGFNGGDPYAASRDAGAAVLNTNIATAVSVIVWTIMDIFYFKKPSVIGAVQGMITGLVAITPAAGVVDGWGAIAIGISSGIIPWLSMNLLGKTAIFRKVDDTLGVFHTHAVAGVLGGIMTGLLATKAGCAAYALSTPGGAIEGNWHQVWLQLIGAAFIIALNLIVTYILLKLISLIVPLRMSEEELLIGDDAVHGEEAYAFYGDGERRPVTGD